MAREGATSTSATTDHDTIREWAEARGGKPSHVKDMGSGDDVGILRIDFPGYSGADSLEEISWEDWFVKFEEADLALLYRDEEESGDARNFNKLVSRDSVEDLL